MMSIPIASSVEPLDSLSASWRAQAPTESEIFTDPGIYKAEMERLYSGPVWHLVAHVSELPSDGCYKTHRIGDVPVVITRTEGSFFVMVNSCAHRGAQVVRGARGRVTTPAAFTCIYHQWVYDAKGSVLGVGQRKGYGDDFKVGEFGLSQARVAVVGGMIFASLGKNPPPIEDYLGERVISYLTRLYGVPGLRYGGVQRAIFQCNWKLYVENVYDSYHAVTLHKGFRLMKIRKAAPQMEDPSILKYGHYLTEYEAEVPARLDLDNPDIFEMRSRTDGVSGHVVANLFPSTQFTEQLDVLSYRTVIPRGPEATEIQFHVLTRDGDNDVVRRQSMWQAANFLGPQGLINLEDAAALARTQVGMRGRSRVFDGTGSRRFPDRRTDEAAIDKFYAAWRRAMFPGQDTNGGAA
jgi:phenylpropionate dioxygenase-like ring-hydroxylating dioxygenase large terminal subunit